MELAKLDSKKATELAIILWAFVEPVRLRSNEFWGERSGSNEQRRGLIFKGRRAALSGRGPPKKRRANENKGGVGRKYRRRKGYANPKLARRYRGN